MGLIPEAKCWRPLGSLNILLEPGDEIELVKKYLATPGGRGGGSVVGTIFRAFDQESRDAMVNRLGEVFGAADAPDSTTDYQALREVDRSVGF